MEKELPCPQVCCCRHLNLVIFLQEDTLTVRQRVTASVCLTTSWRACLSDLWELDKIDMPYVKDDDKALEQLLCKRRADTT